MKIENSLFLRFMLVSLILCCTTIFMLGEAYTQQMPKTLSGKPGQQKKQIPLKAKKVYTPTTPEVSKAIDRAVSFMEKNMFSETRPGGAAIAALAVLKHTGAAEHPIYEYTMKCIHKKIQNAWELEKPDPKLVDMDIYSTGIVIIFLLEWDSSRNNELAQFLLDSLEYRMRPYGGWGYPSGQHAGTADTSMTQYGVLSHWTALQEGLRVNKNCLEQTADWLFRTQDPSGGFGYQGRINNASDYAKNVKQSGVRLSMSAAGLGSVYICADALGMERAKNVKDADFPELRMVVKEDARVFKSALPKAQFYNTINMGNGWFNNNFDVVMPSHKSYECYYLYALERYMSFREMLEGKPITVPDWYSLGAEKLLETQDEKGSWGNIPDTAFGALFLLRSMKKTLEKEHDYGPGIMIGGRGLPKNTDTVMVRNGKVVSKTDTSETDDLIAALQNPQDENYDTAIATLAEMPEELSKLASEKHGDLLRQLVANKSPEARHAAVVSLGRSGDLDHVPVLIYALTDPDPNIVFAASDALCTITRSMDNYGLEEGFTEKTREEAIQRWKEWYLRLRPGTVFESY